MSLRDRGLSVLMLGMMVVFGWQMMWINDNVQYVTPTTERVSLAEKYPDVDINRYDTTETFYIGGVEVK